VIIVVMLDGECKSWKLLIMQFSAVSCYFLPLLLQVLYLPQHSILEHCGSTCPCGEEEGKEKIHLPDVLFVFSITNLKKAFIFTNTQ
jgi:hypothetical protein